MSADKLSLCKKPEINTFDEFYQCVFEEKNGYALTLMDLYSWFVQSFEFDPVSGEALEDNLSHLLLKINKFNNNEKKDRFVRIVEHCYSALHSLVKDMNEKILREHSLVPVYKAKEFDSSSVQWLSKQPGRTVREKLSAKRNVMAVTKRFSFDSVENRLVKSCAAVILENLYKRKISDERYGNLQEILTVWFMQDEIKEIRPWVNMLPNNTLLQDKRYRKVLDSWNFLHCLDEQTKNDFAEFEQIYLTVLLWTMLAKLNRNSAFKLCETNVSCDFNSLALKDKRVFKTLVLGYNDYEIGTVLKVNVKNLSLCILKEKEQFEFYGKTEKQQNLINQLRVGDSVLFLLKNQKVIDLAKVKEIDFIIKRHTIEVFAENKKFLNIAISDNRVRVNFLNRENSFSPNYATIETLADLIYQALFANSADRISEFARTEQTEENVVVDLTMLYPRYSYDGVKQKKFSFRMLYQIDEQNKTCIDCGLAKALYFDERRFISILDMYKESSEVTFAQKNLVAGKFAEKLERFLHSKNLVYIVNDWATDFELEALKKGINFSFKKSVALPKSIAAIFLWQQNAVTVPFLKESEKIYFIEPFYKGICITPLEMAYSEAVKKSVPELNGIVWERYPSIIIETNCFKNEKINALDAMGCTFSDSLLSVLGDKNLKDEAGKLALYTDDKWFVVPYLTQDSKKVSVKELLYEEIRKAGEKSSKINIITLNSKIENELKADNRWNVLKTSQFITNGAFYLMQLSEKFPDLIFWKDHLPDLGIEVNVNGQLLFFDLVKDEAVIPKRGQKVEIPIDRHFILPSGRTGYEFELRQGSGRKQLNYMISLHSLSFPYAEEMECKLKMEYTYGLEMPYSLTFIPLGNGIDSSKKIEAVWKEYIGNEEVLVPAFPRMLEWEELIDYSDKKGSKKLLFEAMDALQSLKEKIEILLDDINHIVSAEIVYKAKDKNGKIYYKLQQDFYSFDTLFCHSNNFADKNIDLCLGDNVYCVVGDDNKVKFASLNRHCADEWIARFIEHHFLSNEKFLKFALRTIWNNNRSLQKLPAQYVNMKDKLAELLDDYFWLLRNISGIMNNYPKLKRIYYRLHELFLSMHSDAYFVFKEYLEDCYHNGIIKDYFAYCIASGEYDWQQRLFNSLFEETTLNELIMLNIALWRDENLIYTLSYDNVRQVSDKLIKFTQKLLSAIVSQDNNEQIRTIRKISSMFELMLALLRLRKSDNGKIKKFFSPKMAEVKKYIKLIEEIKQVLSVESIREKFRSRISMELEKNQDFENTPDLIYALELYLKGDRTASYIKIKEIGED